MKAAIDGLDMSDQIPTLFSKYSVADDKGLKEKLKAAFNDIFILK